MTVRLAVRALLDYERHFCLHHTQARHIAATGRRRLDASERRSVVYAWTPLMLVTLLIDSMFESFTLSGLGWLMLVLCAVRAGQSRSWRARLRSGEESPGLDPEGLPDLGSEPGPFGAQAG